MPRYSSRGVEQVVRSIASGAPTLPPFDAATAIEKVRLAEDGWNRRDPAKVALAYTPDSQWRNRAEFFSGREAIQAFLTRKWIRELDYRLIKELWTFAGNRIAVRFAYEFHDDSNNWFRAYGNENWELNRGRSHAPAHRQHQRASDRRSGSKVSLAARAPPRRPPRSQRASASEQRRQTYKSHNRVVPVARTTRQAGAANAGQPARLCNNHSC